MRRAAVDADDTRHKRIGAKLRLARQAAGLSQTKLGEGLGVSFQQVQKYERGSNRLSVAALERSCAILGISTSALLSEGPLDHAMGALVGSSVADERVASEIYELVVAYAKISKPAVRRRIRDLVVFLGQAEEDG